MTYQMSWVNEALIEVEVAVIIIAFRLTMLI